MPSLSSFPAVAAALLAAACLPCTAAAAPLLEVPLPESPTPTVPVADPTAPHAFLATAPVAAAGLPASPRQAPVRSVDGGRTWTPLASWPAGARAGSFATTPRASGVIWVLEPEGDVIRSLDGGASWIDAGDVPIDPDHEIVSPPAVHALDRDRAMVVDERQPNWPGTLCSRTIGRTDTVVEHVLHVTRDGGTTWPSRLRSTRTRIVEAGAVDVAGGRLVAVVGTRARGTMNLCLSPPREPDRYRLLTSDDDGRTWRASGPVARGAVSGMAIDPGDGRRVAVAEIDGDVRLTEDAGSTWRPVGRVADGAVVAFTARGTLIAAHPGGPSVPLRLPRGAAVAAPIAGWPSGVGFTAVAANGDDVLIADAVASALLRSTDDGATVVDDVDAGAPTVPQPFSFVATRLGPGVAAAGRLPVLRVGVGGALPAPVGLPRHVPLGWLAARDGLALAVADHDVRLSTDAGATWTTVPAPARHLSLGAVAVAGTIAVGRDDALWISASRGAAWRRIAVPSRVGRAVQVAFRGDELVIADDRGGIWLRRAGRFELLLARTRGRCGRVIEDAPPAGSLLVGTCRGIRRLAGGRQRLSALPAGDAATAIRIARAPSTPRRVIAVRDHSLLESRDDGRTWRRIGSLGGLASGVAWLDDTTVAALVWGETSGRVAIVAVGR